MPSMAAHKVVTLPEQYTKHKNPSSSIASRRNHVGSLHTSSDRCDWSLKSNPSDVDKPKIIALIWDTKPTR